jgi:PTS system nitrogen regulatory IIA component
MNIANILAPTRVQFQREIGSKKRVLEEISRLLAGGTPSLSESEILGSLTGREKLGSTGLGQGVAIPHGRMRGLTSSVGAFIRLQDGVDYEAGDGQKVDLVFGLLVPQDCTEEHLKILAALAEMFLDEQFCAAIRSTQDPQALHKLLLQYVPVAAA